MLLQTVARLLFSAIQGISVVIAFYIYTLCQQSVQWAHTISLDRASPSEFVIPLAKYNKALYTQVSLGMRFRMLFETEDSGVRRYMGTITGIGDLDPVQWKNSHWRNLQVSHSSWAFTCSDIHVLQLPDSYASYIEKKASPKFQDRVLNCNFTWLSSSFHVRLVGMNQLHLKGAPVFQYGKLNQFLHHFIYVHHHFSGQSFLSSRECQVLILLFPRVRLLICIIRLPCW
jgi:hypothetical protein